LQASNDALRAQIAQLQSQLSTANGLDLSTRTLQHFVPPTLASDAAYSTLLYRVDADAAVAYISLNRPNFMNAILWPMPFEIEHAVQRANRDPRVHCIVVSGEGRGFCAGYDLKHYAESERGTIAGSQNMPWCPYVDYAEMQTFVSNTRRRTRISQMNGGMERFMVAFFVIVCLP